MFRFFFLFFALLFGTQAAFEEVDEAQLPTNPSELSQSPASKTLWQPIVGEKWQIVLNSTINLNTSAPLEPKDVNVFEVDLFDTPETTIQEMRRRGIKVTSYHIRAGNSFDLHF